MSGNIDLSDVSIVVLSYNRKDDLERNLAGLTALAENCGCELIVVDNASTDGSGEMIADALRGRRDSRFIGNDANLGVAGGRNAGWRAATRDFILNIDDDTFVSGEAIHAMLAVMRARPEVAIVSPRILRAETQAKQFDLGGTLCSVANFHGACHLVRAALIERIGANDELCSFGGEEIDYSIRTRAAAFDIVFTPDATVLHKNFARTGTDGAGRRRRWLYNFIRVYHKHFPPGFASVLSARYFLSHVVSGARAHGLLFATQLLPAAFLGVRDGRRQHAPVPGYVVQFYRNPDLRPEFGNRPIWRKLADKLRR